MDSVPGRGIFGMLTALAAALFLAGCPLPFQFSPEGYPGTGGSSDPSTPGISASPSIAYTESNGGGGSIPPGGTAATSSHTTVRFFSETVGAAIYYTTDGSTPDPRGGNTFQYNPASPPTVAIPSPSVGNSQASRTFTAVAIGPNLKPSLVTSGTVALAYPQAAQPVFSPVAGAYSADQNIQISTPTTGASVYYTIVEGNGPAPRPVPGQAGTQAYTGPVSLAGPSSVHTIAAIAAADGLIESATASATYSISYPGLPAPVFSPAPGTYANSQTVTISSAAGSTIWYEEGGAAPVPGTSPSIASGQSLTLNGGPVRTLRALATKSGAIDSPISQAVYTFKAAQPEHSPPGGTYYNDIDIVLTSDTDSSSLWWTYGPTTPPQSGIQYTGPITLATSATMRAQTVRTSFEPSDISSHAYTLKVAPVTFSQTGGTYPASMTITLGTITAGAEIRFRVNSGAEMLYTGTPIPIPSGATTTVQAYGTRLGYQDGTPVSVTYTIPAPPASPALRGVWTNSIQATWTAVPGAVGYRLERSANAGFVSYTTVYTGTSTEYVDTGLTTATTYYYRVRAQFSSGLGDPSAVNAATTLTAGQLPVLATITATGLAKPPQYQPGYDWDTYISQGWTYGTYTYIVWYRDIYNSMAFAISSYDGSYNLVSYWFFPGNRYITSVTLDNDRGEFSIVGQQGTTVVPWYQIMP